MAEDTSKPGTLLKAKGPRDYFEQYSALGNRAIFRWTIPQEWPNYDLLVRLAGSEHRYEGVVFADEHAARAFDLDRVADRDGDQCWMLFDSWDEAQFWLTTAPKED